MDLKRTALSVRAERAVLAAVILPRDNEIADPLAELDSLARTAGSSVRGRLIQKRSAVDPSSCIGRGKVEELKLICDQCDADVIIFDCDLKPAQLRNLEEATGLKVIDRTEIILDIFATRAKTVQAKLQVELAQLEYALPRLRKMWTHLSRVEGGIGMRGPGEQQLETDRRIARRRIMELKKSLEKIGSRRQRQVESRFGKVNICMVGYTNTGKSTLMNRLTGGNFLVEDRLFATLDTRTRKWKMRGGSEVLLSDTIGFIRNLPHHLVASFHATLEEVSLADVLLHVVDAASPSPSAQINAVENVLSELGCGDKPCVMVFNKMDSAPDSVELATACGSDRPSVFLSALNGDGVDRLEDAVEEAIGGFMKRIRISIPVDRQRLVSFVRKTGGMISIEHKEDGIIIHARLRDGDIEKLMVDGGVEVALL